MGRYHVRCKTEDIDYGLVDWVENGHAPDFVVATHSTDGVVDNERPICACPQRAVYTGPAGGENDPINWVESNFTC